LTLRNPLLPPEQENPFMPHEQQNPLLSRRDIHKQQQSAVEDEEPKGVKRMPTYLENLMLKEISFVDRGANPGARVSIFKRDSSGDVAKAETLTPAQEREAARRIAEMEAKERPGTRGPVSKFEEAVNDLAKDFKLSGTAAMTMARRDFPALYKAFQQGSNDGAAEINKGDPVRQFEQIALKVQARDRCTPLEAFEKAAREYPVEREAFAKAG
jgi:hypothetical protein